MMERRSLASSGPHPGGFLLQKKVEDLIDFS
jgi:hypothetical protein